jgi:High potential iron-sulfur protein
MKDNINQSRRSMLKFGSMAVFMVPVAAFAAKNAPIRTAMKYKDTPEGDKKCSNCLQFVPGKTPTDLGGCKVFAGDTEISPNGYCTAWAKKP